MEKKERRTGIDLIKALAVVFVISIHTIGNLHVLSMDMHGTRAFLIVVFRYFVMSCVPLFLMITGFLQAHKKPNKKFYLGIAPVAASYCFIAALGALYNMHIDSTITWQAALLSIFNFTANNYAWYVEMFLGLYLLIPFLNGGYAYLETKKAKLWLLAVLALLTIAPSLTSVFRTPAYYVEVIPKYWVEFYPVCYYLIGVYIREYKPRVNPYLCLVCALISAVIPAAIVFMLAHGGAYVDYVFNGFYSVSSLLTALFLFLAFYNTTVWSKPLRFVLSSIAVSSLDIYLFSNLAEKIVYPYIGALPLKLPFTIAVIFVVSFAAAKGKQLIFFLVKKGWHLLRPAKQEEQAAAQKELAKTL